MSPAWPLTIMLTMEIGIQCPQQSMELSLGSEAVNVWAGRLREWWYQTQKPQWQLTRQQENMFLRCRFQWRSSALLVGIFYWCLKSFKANTHLPKWELNWQEQHLHLLWRMKLQELLILCFWTLANQCPRLTEHSLCPLLLLTEQFYESTLVTERQTNSRIGIFHLSPNTQHHIYF